MMVATPTPIEKSDLLFEVVFKDKVVGTLNAERRSEGNKVIYTNLSQVEVNLVKRIEMVYETQVVYEDSVMVSAQVITSVNGKVRKTMETKREGNGYKFYKNGRCTGCVEGPIRYSAIMMLFDEPGNVEETYSEEAGCFFRIETKGGSCYSKVNGRGKKSSYHYSHGTLERMTIEGGLFNFEMVSG
jgi:hypothetical protein